ncbi:MAG: hypothetical protein ACOZE5_02330 [Verrucomicrobiota bacterium]
METPEPSPQSVAQTSGGAPPADRLFFLTLTTQGRQPWLAIPRTRDVFLAVLRSWHMERDGRVLAAMAMPDHAQVLLEPGKALTTVQLVARWKTAMRMGAGYAETFQNDTQGHRLQVTENPEDYGLYLFLKPYRARLIRTDQPWPGWWLPDPAAFTFPAALNKQGCPPPAWADWPEEKFARLNVPR